MNDLCRETPAKQKTILIVEDNRLNMKLFSDVLTSRGFNVVGTSSGTEAHEIASRTSPDLILMDIQLSEMSGYEIIAALKASESTSTIPIIAVTAYAMQEDERKVRAMGCASYISKPIFIGPFIQEIEKALAENEEDGSILDDDAPVVVVTEPAPENVPETSDPDSALFIENEEAEETEQITTEEEAPYEIDAEEQGEAAEIDASFDYTILDASSEYAKVVVDFNDDAEAKEQQTVAKPRDS